MTKSERPPIRMFVRGGHLVPASAYDEERFDEIAPGTEFDCVLTEIRNEVRNKLERKYWAVLGKLIKVANTPWKRASDASEWLKFHLGVVAYAAQPGREDSLRYTRSLRDLTDDEFSEFFEMAMLVLQRVTGIDPSTIRKEAADTGERPDEPPASSQDAGVGGGDPLSSTHAAADHIPDEIAPDPPGDDGGGAADDLKPTPGSAAEPDQQPFADNTAAEVGGDGGTPSPPPTTVAADQPEADERAMVNSADPPKSDNLDALMTEAINKALAITKDKDLNQKEREALLKQIEPLWLAQIPDHPGFVKQVFSFAQKVVRGEVAYDTAKRFLFSYR